MSERIAFLYFVIAKLSSDVVFAPLVDNDEGRVGRVLSGQPFLGQGVGYLQGGGLAGWLIFLRRK